MPTRSLARRPIWNDWGNSLSSLWIALQFPACYGSHNYYYGNYLQVPFNLIGDLSDIIFPSDDCREAIPSLVEIGTVSFKPRSGSEVAPAMGSSCIFLLFLLRPLLLKWGFYAVPKAFYRSYDITLLPVTCLDMHAYHLVAVSTDAGYKRRKFPSQRQLSPDGWQVSTSPHYDHSTMGPLPPGILPGAPKTP